MSPCVNRTTRAPLTALTVHGLTFPPSCFTLQHRSKGVDGDKDTQNTKSYSCVTWPKHQSPEIATQTHQVKRASWRSWTSLDKDQVTQPYLPNLIIPTSLLLERQNLLCHLTSSPADLLWHQEKQGGTQQLCPPACRTVTLWYS